MLPKIFIFLIFIPNKYIHILQLMPMNDLDILLPSNNPKNNIFLTEQFTLHDFKYQDYPQFIFTNCIKIFIGNYLHLRKPFFNILIGKLKYTLDAVAMPSIFLCNNKLISNRMLQIDHTLTSIAPDESPIETKKTTQSYYSNFFKVVRQLRDTDQKISRLKNRVASMGLKTIAKIQKNPQFRNSPSLRQIYLDKKDKKEKQIIGSQIEMKKIINQDNSKILNKRLIRAKRVMTEEKFRIHDQVRQKSLHNLRKIEQSRREYFTQKQKIHDKLYKREKEKKNILRHFEQKKKEQVQRFCKEQVLYASRKVEEREMHLYHLKKQCEEYQKRFTNKNTKRKDKKLKKIWSLRKNIGERTARQAIQITLQSFFNANEKLAKQGQTNPFTKAIE